MLRVSLFWRDLSEVLNLKELIRWYYIPNYLKSLHSEDSKALILNMKYREVDNQKSANSVDAGRLLILQAKTKSKNTEELNLVLQEFSQYLQERLNQSVSDMASIINKQNSYDSFKYCESEKLLNEKTTKQIGQLKENYILQKKKCKKN